MISVQFDSFKFLPGGAVGLALSMLSDQRMVLFPQGQPVERGLRDRCMELVLWCGGDVGRIMDPNLSTVEHFAEYLNRIKGLRDATELAMVVLTRTNPLALTVVDARRRLESRVPSLKTARWAIFLDPGEDPFFEVMALRLGHLSASLNEAPLWISSNNSPFLVLSSVVQDRSTVFEALAELDEANLIRSGERMVPSRYGSGP